MSADAVTPASAAGETAGEPPADQTAASKPNDADASAAVANGAAESAQHAHAEGTAAPPSPQRLDASPGTPPQTNLGGEALHDPHEPEGPPQTGATDALQSRQDAQDHTTVEGESAHAAPPAPADPAHADAPAPAPQRPAVHASLMPGGMAPPPGVTPEQFAAANLYVDGLGDASDDDLAELFRPHGNVLRTKTMDDRGTGACGVHASSGPVAAR
jgi:hypothetical protein